jgi:hypothetical protein
VIESGSAEEEIDRYIKRDKVAKGILTMSVFSLLLRGLGGRRSCRVQHFECREIPIIELRLTDKNYRVQWERYSVALQRRPQCRCGAPQFLDEIREISLTKDLAKCDGGPRSAGGCTLEQRSTVLNLLGTSVLTQAL